MIQPAPSEAGRAWSDWFDGLHVATRHPGRVRWVVRAKHFADERFEGPVSLESMAREAYLSKYHFVRAFRRIFRETPGRYVTHRRIARARKLLERSDLSVTAICFEVGFESLGSFITRFKQVTGESPGRYRRRFAARGSIAHRAIPACLYEALKAKSRPAGRPSERPQFRRSRPTDPLPSSNRPSEPGGLEHDP